MYLTMFIVSRVILVLALASLATSSRTPEPLQMFAHSIEGTADEMKACHESSCKGHCSHTPHCVWCASEKLPSGCFHEAEAKLLPGMLYTCDAEQSMGPMQHMMGNVMGAMQHMMGNMMAAADPCEGKDQFHCDDTAECVWCASSAVPSSCFTTAQAKFLPPAVFVCDTKPSVKPSATLA